MASHEAKSNQVYKETTVYDNSTSFSKFLSWSNEKEVLASEIIQIVGRDISLLDIGAGDGNLTKRLIPVCSNIVAVEPSKLCGTLFDNIKQCGGIAVNSKIEDYIFSDYATFDVILASHSLRYVKDVNYQISRLSRKLANHTGLMIVIEISPTSAFWDFYIRYEKMIPESLKRHKTDPSEYDYTIPLLKNFDNMRSYDIQSVMTAPSPQEFVSILDFIFDVEPEHIPQTVIDSILREGINSLTFDHRVYVGSGQISLYGLT